VYYKVPRSTGIEWIEALLESLVIGECYSVRMPPRTLVQVVPAVFWQPSEYTGPKAELFASSVTGEGWTVSVL